MDRMLPSPRARCRATSTSRFYAKVGRQVNPKQRIALTAATALALATLSPAAAKAAARPDTSCYQFGYTYNINSYEIQVTATWACPGEQAPDAYMVLLRYQDDYYAYVTTNDSPTYSTTLTYICDGTAPNSYEIQPEFTGGSGYTTYSFTDDCG
jgi:hypothetical protein